MKKELREKIMRLRNSHCKKEKEKKDEEIKRLLFSTKEFKFSKLVLFYYPIKDEVDTTKMIEESLKLGKRVFLPVTDVKNHKLIISEINTIDDLIEGAFGILEPKNTSPVKINNIELVIVPGIAFDKRGYRIGYGMGYYDKLLNGFDKHTIGLAYDFQIVKKIPNETHDIPVKKIITEKRIIECDKNGQNNER